MEDFLSDRSDNKHGTRAGVIRGRDALTKDYIDCQAFLPRPVLSPLSFPLILFPRRISCNCLYNAHLSHSYCDPPPSLCRCFAHSAQADSRQGRRPVQAPRWGLHAEIIFQLGCGGSANSL